MKDYISRDAIREKYAELQRKLPTTYQSVQKMHELGYVQLPEKEDGQGKWCFKPKTYFLEPVSNFYKLTEEGE